MASRLILLAALLSVACPRPPKPVVPGPSDWPDVTPLTDAEETLLAVPDVVWPLLPNGRGTPVRRLIDQENDQALLGFSFAVRPGAASLTVHAIRRQLAQIEAEHQPLVYGTPGPGEGRHPGVSLLLRSRDELTALRLGTGANRAARTADLNAFLTRWSQSATISLLAVGGDAAWIEVDRLPDDQEEAEELLDALLGRMSENVGPDALQDDIDQGYPVELSLAPAQTADEPARSE